MTDTTTSRRGGYAVTNDLTLIREIIRLAVSPGFVLVGPAQRVLTYQPERGRAIVAAVPKYEADAVAQLLGAGHLKVGGTHTVQYGEHTGTASSVLVPKATRDMVARWDNLRPLHPPSRQHGQHGHGGQR